MARPRRAWTRTAAELYASKYPTARLARDIYRKCALRSPEDPEAQPMRVSIFLNGDVVVEYRDGRKLKYKMRPQP